jgi:sulfur-carrier protein
MKEPLKMRVRVRYFASLREALGPGEEVELVGGGSVGSLRDALLNRGGRHAEVLSRQRAVRAAVNQVMAEESAPLAEGAEVAFFPPVTGG